MSSDEREPASLGLKGWAATVANLSAVAFMGVLFWLSLQQVFKSAAEDRAMFRQELSALRQDIRDLSNEVRKSREAKQP